MTPIIIEKSFNASIYDFEKPKGLNKNLHVHVRKASKAHDIF